MHYLPFMAAITLFPLVGRGDEGSGGGVGVCEGETQPSEALLARVMAQWRDGGGGHVYNEDALSAALYCTLSLIGAQIRASHYNHLHTDHCTVQRGDVAAMTADPLMWPPRGNGGTAVRQLCRLEHRIGKAHIELHVLPCFRAPRAFQRAGTRCSLKELRLHPRERISVC